MKNFKKIAKSSLSVIMALIMVISMTAISVVGASATGTSISYNFTGDESAVAGYAQGTITFTSSTAGTYYLYWADETKALDGFYPITTMTLTANGSDTFTFGDHTAIPAGATKVIATTSQTNLTVASAVATYSIPASKQLLTGAGDELYSFSSYSDVHIDPEGYYKNAEKNWAQALQFSYEKGADFIVSSGDMVNYGYEKEWEIYLDILADSPYDNPVWESNGNHDLRGNEAEGNTYFVRYTGTDSTTANFDANKPYYSVTEESTGDLFIFMAFERYKATEGDTFSAEQIAWVTQLLEENYGTGKNIYLIEHSPIEGFGAGDRMSDPYYKAHLSQKFVTTVQFKSLIQKYPEVIWMSGHTHQDYQMDYNYSNENDTACNMIHNSAVVGSTWADPEDTSQDYNDGYGYNSQGYHVEVYENNVVYYGANLTEELYYPAYCYVMNGARNTTADDVNETDPITTQATEPKSYSLPSSFNGWSTDAKMTAVDDTHYVYDVELPAGSYEFKVNDGESWYGNADTIDNSTNGVGWTMDKSVSGNCKLTALGGYYTFTLDTTTMKIVVDYAEEKPTEPIGYEMGDVNCDNEINISDVTLIQKALAKLETLTSTQEILADYDESGVINIKDATKIQYTILGYEVVETTESKTVASVGAGTLSDANTSAKTELANYYFASYDQYQAVKKMYNTYKDKTTATSEVVADYEAKIKALQEIIEHIGSPEIYELKNIYYFVNTKNWSTVNAYAWTSDSNASWPGVAMEVCGTYNGYDVYGIKFTSAGQYENIIFNNGSVQTVDISLSDYEYNCFMLSTMSGSKYTVSNFEYSDATTEPTAPGEDATEDTLYALNYYNGSYHNWGSFDTFFTPQSDGTYILNFTTTNAEAISFQIYNTKTAIHNCLSASKSITYTAGETQSISLVTNTSKGKSITISGLSTGVLIQFVYNPTTNAVTITF